MLPSKPYEFYKSSNRRRLPQVPDDLLDPNPRNTVNVATPNHLLNPSELISRQLTIVCLSLELHGDLEASTKNIFQQIMDANIVFKVPSSNKLSTEPNKNDVATNPFHRESKDAGIPAPTYATRVWVVCSVFAACIANEDGVRMKTTSTALHALTHSM